jgi:hypothetical protein
MSEQGTEGQFEDKHIGYLPIPCPCCGRRRVEGTLRTILIADEWHAVGDQFVCAVKCEKCGADEDWDHPAAEPGCSPTLHDGIPEGYVRRDDLP